MKKLPKDRTPKSGSDLIVVSAVELEKTRENWQKSQKNQITVINLLQGKIDLVRDIANSPSLSPEEALHKIKEIL